MAFAATVAKATQVFARLEDTGEITPEVIERLRVPGSLLDVARDVLKLSGDEADYIAGIPASAREGMRAGIVNAIDEGKRIQFGFRPGGTDHIVSLYEYDDAFVVMVEGPC